MPERPAAFWPLKLGCARRRATFAVIHITVIHIHDGAFAVIRADRRAHYLADGSYAGAVPFDGADPVDPAADAVDESADPLDHTADHRRSVVSGHLQRRDLFDHGAAGAD